jgi:multiple sugar transport system permease protein
MTASVISARRSRMVPRLSYDERSAYLFVAPLAAVLLIVAVFPIVYSFYISLYNLKLTRPWKVPFVGLANYETVLTSATFWALSPSASSRCLWRFCSTRISPAAGS